MAIYFVSPVKIVGRAGGKSVLASAAYQRAAAMTEEAHRFGDVRRATEMIVPEQRWDYSKKKGVVHAELAVPPGAPSWVRELAAGGHAGSERFWNTVNHAEGRADAQFARRFDAALPVELNHEQMIAAAREFAGSLTENGMVVDWALHDEAVDPRNPHAHFLLSMRELAEHGLGKKVREWNSRELALETIDQGWAIVMNKHLALAGLQIQVDHRSYAERGLALEGGWHMGPAAAMERRGIETGVGEEQRGVRARNAERIARRPELVLEKIARSQSTFTRQDIARELARHITAPDEFTAALARVEASPELVRLPVNDPGHPDRYTTRETLATEKKMLDNAEFMAAQYRHQVSERLIEATIRKLDERLAAGGGASAEQKIAVRKLLGPEDFVALRGAAGTGKTTLLSSAKTAWTASGLITIGGAPTGRAAQNLREAGIESRTIASWQKAWTEGREQLTKRHVLVIDESAMLDSRATEMLLADARKAGAKVVLVGDDQQTQAIGAGGAFRAIGRAVGVAELTEVVRQKYEWQRLASSALGERDNALGVRAYEAHGKVHWSDSELDSKVALIRDWRRETGGQHLERGLILAHRNRDVDELNSLARGLRKSLGELGVGEHEITIRRRARDDDDKAVWKEEKRSFAAGDRIVFTLNDRVLGVSNGSRGTISTIARGGRVMTVKLDDGRRAEFDTRKYNSFDLGYAITVHKSQGTTVDRAWLYASRSLDRHLAYVALTRHRDDAVVFAARDEFGARRLDGHRESDEAIEERFHRVLGRDGAKTTAIEFAEARRFDVEAARQRQIERQERGIAARLGALIGLGQRRAREAQEAKEREAMERAEAARRTDQRRARLAEMVAERERQEAADRARKELGAAAAFFTAERARVDRLEREAQARRRAPAQSQQIDRPAVRPTQPPIERREQLAGAAAFFAGERERGARLEREAERRAGIARDAKERAERERQAREAAKKKAAEKTAAEPAAKKEKAAGLTPREVIRAALLAAARDRGGGRER